MGMGVFTGTGMSLLEVRFFGLGIITPTIFTRLTIRPIITIRPTGCLTYRRHT